MAVKVGKKESRLNQRHHLVMLNGDDHCLIRTGSLLSWSPKRVTVYHETGVSHIQEGKEAEKSVKTWGGS